MRIREFPLLGLLIAGLLMTSSCQARVGGAGAGGADLKAIQESTLFQEVLRFAAELDKGFAVKSSVKVLSIAKDYPQGLALTARKSR